MSALQTVLDAGLHLRTDGDRLIVAPSSLLDDPLRDLIRANKVELLAGARDAETVAADLIAAINRCCAVRSDDAANIAALIAESYDFTVEARRDLIAHFNGEAAIWSAATGAAQ